MRGILTFIISAVVGYFFFRFYSPPLHLSGKQKKRLPKLSIWRVDILPNFRIHVGSKTYWIHHWFWLSIIVAVPIIIREDFQFPMVVEGLLVGGIIQGLRYPDRFSFRHPRLDQLERRVEEIRKEIKIFTDSVAVKRDELGKEFKHFTDSVGSGEFFEPKEKKKN